MPCYRLVAAAWRDPDEKNRKTQITGSPKTQQTEGNRKPDRACRSRRRAWLREPITQLRSDQKCASSPATGQGKKIAGRGQSAASEKSSERNVGS
eukprot:915196-Pleurochrysis_carterae.AAC.1